MTEQKQAPGEMQTSLMPPPPAVAEAALPPKTPLTFDPRLEFPKWKGRPSGHA